MPEVSDIERITVACTCPICKKSTYLTVSLEAYVDWESGKTLIQDAFPGLTADERERLITGICNNCWNSLLPDDEEEEEE